MSSSNSLTKQSNRWIIAAAGVIMQLFLGTVYAWSVFKKPIMESQGWSGREVGFTFTLLIGFLGLAAAFGGGWVDKTGTRKIATVGALLFGLGTLLAGVAIHIGSKWLLYIGYGVIGGVGNGLGYITPIAVLVRWFPDKRGFITGLAVMGFGFGAAIMGKLGPYLISHYGVANTFYFSGLSILVILSITAQFLDNPPLHPSLSEGVSPSKHPLLGGESVDLRQALNMNQFYLLWFIFCINITAGISLISNLSPMVQQQTGLLPAAAGGIVFITSLCNGLGRIFWSSISDKIGRKSTFIILLLTQIPIFLWLPKISNVLLFTILSCYILLCYGGGFSTMPAFTADTFGSKNIGRIYGMILLAWGVAAAIGPMLMEYIKSISDTFSMALYIASALLFLAFLLILFYKKPVVITD